MNDSIYSRRGQEKRALSGPRSTTILALRHRGVSVMIGDGQATSYRIEVRNAKKVTAMNDGKVLLGYSGGNGGDCVYMRDKFNELLMSENNPNRCAKKAGRDFMLWQREKPMEREMDAYSIVMSDKEFFILYGNGGPFDCEEKFCAIGAGGDYAFAAAQALMENTRMSAEQIARKAMKLAADNCPYTNDNFTMLKLKSKGGKS